MTTASGLFVRRLLGVLMATMLAATLAVGVGLAPEPDPVPRRWQFEVQFGDLNLATVAGRQYYYLTYRVTNRSGQDLLFAPSFEMVGSDDSTVRRSGRGVPSGVTATLLSNLGNPLLEDQIGVIGMLQQGPENAKDGLVVWPVDNIRPGSITVFAAGFSGETAIVEVPGVVGADGKKTTMTLRKSRLIQYQDVGDISLKPDGPLSAIDARWVMR